MVKWATCVDVQKVNKPPVVKRNGASVGKPTTCGDPQPVVKRHDFGVRCEMVKGMGAAWKKHHLCGSTTGGEMSWYGVI